MNRSRRQWPECCGEAVAPGVACSNCGKVPGRSRPGLLVPTGALVTSTWAQETAEAVAAVRVMRPVPKPAPKAPRPRRKLRGRNPERMAVRHAEDFGPLADAVRPLRCCVVGCSRTPCDPAHVIGRATGGAWVWSHEKFRTVGNLAPVCRGHHTGMPGFAREVIQHQVGLRAWQRNVGLAVKLPGEPERRVDRLADVAEAVGDWFRAGGRPEAAPC